MVENILKKLPNNLEWMVMFRINGVQRFADNHTINEMYFLNKNTIIDNYEFIVLTSQGRFLYCNINQEFIHGETLQKHSFPQGGLYDVYTEEISNFKIDKADSFATGYYPKYGKVVLYIKFEENIAKAQSVFNNAPDLWFYEYLQAVGVKYVSGNKLKNGKFLAKYENTLSKHIASGILANFSRTDNCNLFFFLHGNINQELAIGIINAGKKRLEFEQKKVHEILEDLAKESISKRLQMNVIQPFTNETFNMGDVVPKGFLFGALDNIMPNHTLTSELKKSLYSDQLRGLWTFEKNDLETSVDSALVLQFLYDKKATALLSKFLDEKSGGFLPQTDALTPKEGDMQYVPEKDHWCQPDIATSALIAFIYSNHDLPISENLKQFIIQNFENRSDLYFANPFFVDWIYARALKSIKSADILVSKLKEEILCSINDDFSTGNFDKVFSTACSILALKELGVEDNYLMPLKLYVLNHYQDINELNPIPFYSSLILQNNDYDPKGNLVNVAQKKLSVYFYQDQYSIIYYSVVAMALNIRSHEIQLNHIGLKDYARSKTPERYGCKNQLEYIEKFGLPIYLNKC